MANPYPYPYQSFNRWASDEQERANKDNDQSEEDGNQETYNDEYLNELKQRQRREEAKDFYIRMKPIYDAEEAEDERIRLADEEQRKKWAEEDEKKKLEKEEEAEAEKKKKPRLR
uniref:Uncharacterized protein n=1 Tax=viral metagenome TaxID=1070528 RepID=A0A6C0LBD9_9ZZZZ